MKTTILVEKTLTDKLKSLKIVPRESYGHVILRLINHYNGGGNNEQKDDNKERIV